MGRATHKHADGGGMNKNIHACWSGRMNVQAQAHAMFRTYKDNLFHLFMVAEHRELFCIAFNPPVQQLF